MDWLFGRSVKPQVSIVDANRNYLQRMIKMILQHVDEDFEFTQFRDKVAFQIRFDLKDVLYAMEKSGALKINSQSVVTLVNKNKFTPKTDSAKYLTKYIFDEIDGHKTTEDVERDVATKYLWGDVGDAMQHMIENDDLETKTVGGKYKQRLILRPTSSKKSPKKLSKLVVTEKARTPRIKRGSPTSSSPRARLSSPRAIYGGRRRRSNRKK